MRERDNGALRSFYSFDAVAARSRAIGPSRRSPLATTRTTPLQAPAPAHHFAVAVVINDASSSRACRNTGDRSGSGSLRHCRARRRAHGDRRSRRPLARHRHYRAHRALPLVGVWVRAVHRATRQTALSLRSTRRASARRSRRAASTRRRLGAPDRASLRGRLVGPGGPVARPSTRSPCARPAGRAARRREHQGACSASADGKRKNSSSLTARNVH